MKRRWLLALWVGVGCALLGCVPRKLFWSRDGQHGAVIGADNGLRLCDPAGNLSKPVASDVQLVSWFLDSKRFIAACVEWVGTWDEIKGMFTEQRRAELTALAEPLRTEVLAYKGKWDEFKPAVKEQLTGSEYAALVLYVRDHHNRGLHEKLGDEWDKLKEVKAGVCRLQMYEVADNTATPGRVIASLVEGVLDIRISPDGKLAAVTVAMPSSDSDSSPFPLGRLLIYSTAESKPPVLAAENVAAFSDWSPDGKYLYYGTTDTPPKGKDGPVLGTLTRREVADHGVIRVPLPGTEDMAAVLFWSMMKVRCLRDGRVLFSACEMSMPASIAESSGQLSLFIIDPAEPKNVMRLPLPRHKDDRLQGLNMGEFELSPDEKRVVLVDSSKGVSVVILANGEIDTVIDSNDKNAGDLPSMPAWRTADELAIAVPSGNKWGSSECPELVLWSLDGKPRCISRKWQETFEEKPKPKPVTEGPQESQPFVNPPPVPAVPAK